VDRAIVLLQSAVGQDPGFALAHAALSEACWAKYQESSDPVWTTRARDAALEALRLDPAQAQVRVSLAVVYQGTGRPREAIDELRRAIELQPRNDDAHRLLGDLLADEGRTEEAIAALETAIALRPDYWRNYSFLGRFYFRTGRYPEAIQAFSHMVELQPDNAWAVQMLGTAYHAAGDTSRALEYYRRSIELAPDARAYTNMGNIHYAEGRYREALSAFQEAVRLDPRSPLKHRNLGDVLRKLGRPQDAARAYERAAELGRERLAVNPSDPQALAHLAVVEAKLGRRREARQAAEKAAALPGADGEAFYCKAVVHALAGEDPQALSELKRAIAHGWSAELAADDEDLESLRDHPEFKALLARRAGGEKESVR
jgi:serine/threonine-protein kinase